MHPITFGNPEIQHPDEKSTRIISVPTRKVDNADLQVGETPFSCVSWVYGLEKR
jgi:hypothetical protein